MGNISSVGSGGVPPDWGKNEPSGASKSKPAKAKQADTPSQPAATDKDTFELTPAEDIKIQLEELWDARPLERDDLIANFVAALQNNPPLIGLILSFNVQIREAIERERKKQEKRD